MDNENKLPGLIAGGLFAFVAFYIVPDNFLNEGDWFKYIIAIIGGYIVDLLVTGWVENTQPAQQNPSELPRMEEAPRIKRNPPK